MFGSRASFFVLSFFVLVLVSDFFDVPDFDVVLAVGFAPEDCVFDFTVDLPFASDLAEGFETVFFGPDGFLVDVGFEAGFAGFSVVFEVGFFVV